MDTSWQKIAARFWLKVDKASDHEGHWFWMGARDTGGYGHLGIPHPTLSGKRLFIKAHRLAYMLLNGPIPDGMYVLHQPPCVIRHCVRHLYLGTPADNIADRERTQRCDYSDRRGENNNTSKYPESDVIALREEYAAGEELPALAAKYGMNLYTAIGIVHRHIWKHLPSPPSQRGKYRHSPYTRDQILALRADHATGQYSVAALARKHGMEYGTTWAIVRGTRWVND